MTILGASLIGLTTAAILGILFWQSSIVAEKLTEYFDKQARHEMELAVMDANNLLATQHADLRWICRTTAKNSNVSNNDPTLKVRARIYEARTFSFAERP
jgi:hypothetical protein